MENDITPLQKQKINEIENLLNEKEDKKLNSSNENFNNKQEPQKDLNQLIITRINEEIAACTNFQAFVQTTFESLGFEIEKNEKALEEYKVVIQNNVVEQFEKGNIDFRFYSAFVNNKLSLWIGGLYLIGTPIVKAINKKRKDKKEKILNGLNNLKNETEPLKNEKPKENKNSDIKENIKAQYN
tara:strand:- start:4515 stop:5066 length:552 start_codon:yes stop_codon:yes gene_type:complete